jgi:von Willebrand factor type A domain
MKLSLGPIAACALLTVAACGQDGKAGFEPPPEQPSFGNDAGTTAPEAGGSNCTSQTTKAEPVGLAMLILMDRSDSMTGASWAAGRKAMIAFADKAAGVDTSLGLSVFPPDATIGTQACNKEAFRPVVPIAPLPENSAAIKDAILAREPAGQTPMTPALEGSYDAMKTYLAGAPGQEGIVILVTDGDPQGCSSTIANVLPTVAAAANGSPRIRTFAIGMTGASFASLNAIATEGQGAPTAFNASGTDPQKELLTALEAVRAGALGCEYVLPTPPPEQGVLDLESVEIAYTPSEFDPEARFRKVAGLAQCGEEAGGFYYDNPQAPRRIILCPASCNAVRAGAKTAKVDVVLGCINLVN